MGRRLRCSTVAGKTLVRFYHWRLPNARPPLPRGGHASWLALLQSLALCGFQVGLGGCNQHQPPPPDAALCQALWPSTEAKCLVQTGEGPFDESYPGKESKMPFAQGICRPGCSVWIRLCQQCPDSSELSKTTSKGPSLAQTTTISPSPREHAVEL